MGEPCCDCAGGTALGQPGAGGPLQSLGVAAVGGLLGSSCCVLQLGLNLVTGGAVCAGFAVLDPLRPLFLVGTASALALRAPAALRTSEGRASLAGSVGLFAALAVSPALLRWRNGGGFSLARALLRPSRPPPGGQQLERAGAAKGASSSFSSPGAGSQAATASSAHRGSDPAVMVWEVSGLKCEGCAAGLKGALQRVEGVEACSVSWGGPSSSRVEVRAQGGGGAGAEAVARLCQEAMAARPGLEAAEAAS